MKPSTFFFKVLCSSFFQNLQTEIKLWLFRNDREKRGKILHKVIKTKRKEKVGAAGSVWSWVYVD